MLNTNFLKKTIYIALIHAIIVAVWGSMRLLKPAQKVRLGLDSVSLDKKAFDPDEGESLNIRYKASKNCSSTVTICDKRGVPVKVLAADQAIPAKPQTLAWDGTDMRGRPVSGGIYFYVISLKDGKTDYTYNPFKRTHGIPLKTVSAFYDVEKNVINYTLPQAACIRIRSGIKNGGPLLITILDWTFKPAGSYTVPWDGKDSSGQIDLASHPMRNLVILAYSLADNSIIVESKKEVSEPAKYTQTPLFSPDLALDRNIHARNFFMVSREPGISMELVGLKKNEKGLPIVNGIVPVKIFIDPRDIMALENSRYELMFYIDTVFIFEEEAGFSPFTYMWDTKGLQEGEHLLTVNLLSYDNNCGVVTRKVFVRSEKNESL